MFREKAGFPPRSEERGFQPARSVKVRECLEVYLHFWVSQLVFLDLPFPLFYHYYCTGDE